MCTSARPCRFRSIGNRSGARGQQHPDDLAAVAGVAHLRGDHREHAGRGARVAVGLAVAQGGVGLVDDDHHRPERPQHGEHLLQVALRLADVLRAEVLQHHAGNADRAGVALGQIGLAGAHGAADQVAHRRRVELAAVIHWASSWSRFLASAWPATRSSV